MARGSNQKLKLLYLMEFLSRQTDEGHPATIQQMRDYLASKDVAAERKSLYDDIEALRFFGLDIVQVKSATTGYYLAGRDFQLPELKLLVDSVQSSRFITKKKSLELIRKIERLTSEYEAQSLHRQVYVMSRIKSMNESIYYNVDEIHSGIAGDRKIAFKYTEYTVKKERVYRHGGKVYEISPFALCWDDENYYLIGYDSEAGILKHFRVDKMASISLLDEARDGREIFGAMDMAAYTETHFGMYSGQVETVQLQFADRLIGPVIDRFGTDVIIIEGDKGTFTVTVRVAVSPQFFGWVCGFEDEVKVIGPEKVVRRMAEHARKVAALYQDADI